jgi:hypothetical protein
MPQEPAAMMQAWRAPLALLDYTAKSVLLGRARPSIPLSKTFGLAFPPSRYSQWSVEH